MLVCSRGGGSGPAAGGGQVQPGGGARSNRQGGSGPAAGGGQIQRRGVRSSWGGQSSLRGGGSVQPVGGGGVSILRPLAGGMPLAFMHEDFLVMQIIAPPSFVWQVQVYNFRDHPLVISPLGHVTGYMGNFTGFYEILLKTYKIPVKSHVYLIKTGGGVPTMGRGF